MADEFCLKMPDFHVTFRDLLRAVNLRHGTNGFTSLPKEGALGIFFALKNPTALAGYFEAVTIHRVSYVLWVCVGGHISSNCCVIRSFGGNSYGIVEFL